MSITLESAARLAALRDKADAVTGESSDTLAGAVDALIAGYGQGSGGDSDAKKGLFYLDDYVDGYPTTLYHNPSGTITDPNITCKNASYIGVMLTNIKKVIVPDTVVEINSSAFAGLKNLEEISNWDRITYLHNSAFSTGAGSLKYTYLPPNLTYIGNSALNNNMRNLTGEIPESVTYIGQAAFQYSGTRSLWKITKLPPNLTYIGDQALWSYRQLLITEIPATVDYIGKQAFNGAYDKTSLTLIKFMGIV